MLDSNILRSSYNISYSFGNDTVKTYFQRKQGIFLSFFRFTLSRSLMPFHLFTVHKAFYCKPCPWKIIKSASKKDMKYVRLCFVSFQISARPEKLIKKHNQY